MPPWRFVAQVKSPVRSGSDRGSRRAVHGKADIGVRLLHGDRAAKAVSHREAESNLRRTGEKTRGRSLEFDNVRPRIRVHENCIRLAYQNVVNLAIEMAQPRRRRPVGTEEIELYERPRSSYVAHRYAKVCRKSAFTYARVEIVGARRLWNRYRRRNKRVCKPRRSGVKHNIGLKVPIDAQHGLGAWQYKESG